jgi:Zn-dependent protease
MPEFAERLQILSVQGVPFLMAIVFHEVAHGLMAKKVGDATAEEAGRLTFNPLPHLDPIGTALPLAGMLLGVPFLFGWARPVPIDPRRFRRLRPGLFLVAAAGPAMNFLLALVSAAIFVAARLWLPEESSAAEFITATALVSVTVNYALGLFNLLPIPPLDGSKLIESLLPAAAARRFESLARFGFGILLVLMFTGALGALRAPILAASGLTIQGVARVFEAGYGFYLTRFGT